MSCGHFIIVFALVFVAVTTFNPSLYQLVTILFPFLRRFTAMSLVGILPYQIYEGL